MTDWFRTRQSTTTTLWCFCQSSRHVHKLQLSDMWLLCHSLLVTVLSCYLMTVEISNLQCIFLRYCLLSCLI